MSDLYQTNLTEKDKKRCLIRLMEAEDEASINLEHFFRDRDYEAKKEVTFGNFKNVLEKALPNITRDEVNALFQEFQTPGNTNKANYESFLYRINQYRKKRRALTDILEQMLENFSSKDNTLFDLFEKADKDQNGTLSKKEFMRVLDDFGVYYDADEMEDFFFFLDSSGDNSISYKELNDHFVKFVKKKGKNLSELTRSSFFKDPNNYWGRKIFEDAHKYLSQNRQTLTEFFKEEGMETDFSISQFDFTKAMNTLVKNLNDDDLFRLINEMDDKNTKKISIKKFQEVYDAIAKDAPNRGDSSPAKKEFEREKRYKDMLKSIAAVISGKHFSYDDFFTKHGYNRHLKTIHEHKFDTALNELDLRLTPDDIRLLKAKLDPDRSGILALDDVFEIKADSSLQTDYIKANLTARENQELKSLLSDFLISTNKRNINLLNEFTRYDFKKEGQLTNDEFVVILKDNQLNIGAQDQDLLIKAFGDLKTRKVNYKAFCEAIQANLNVSQLSQSQSGFGAQASTAKYVDPAKVEQKEKELYKAIREQYATLEDLFVAYDRNKDNTISKPEFVQMLKAVKVELTNDELDAVFDKIDKGKAGKIYFVNMNLAFKPYIEADVKDIIGLIIRSFANDGRSYNEVTRNFPQNASYMKFIDFMDALQSLSKKTNLRDVQFLLSHLNIKLNSQREINWEEFGTALQSTAKRLGVMNDVEEERVFRKTQRQDSFRSPSPTNANKKTEAIIDKLKIKLGLNSKDKILDFYRQLDRDNNKTVELAEFKRTVKLLSPNFTDDELNQAFRAFDINERGRFTSSDLLERLTAPAQPSSPTNMNLQPVSTSPSKLAENRSASLDIIEKTIWAKETFLEIRQQLEKRGDSFHTYFRVDNHKVNIMEVKMNLNRLDINMNERVSQLLNDLCDEVQPNMINLFYFEKCFNYHKDKYEGENARAKSPTDPYLEIREALKKKYLTFEDSFGKYDVGNRGFITSGALKTILEDDLKLYIGSDSVRRIIDQTADSEGRVSLVKLRDGIGLSRREEPKDDPKNVNIEELLKSLRAAMKNNDLTVDRLFGLFDQSKDGRISWDEFQKFMLKINGSMTRNESVALFRHIDKYGSGEISQADFRAVFEDAGDRADKTVQALKDMIKRNKIDTKRAFEMFDRNRNDSIEFSELSEVISNINPDLAIEDKRLIFRRLDVNQDGKITKTEFIKIFGEGVAQPTENKSLRIQRLLDDLKQSMRPRNRADTEKLFAFVDVNRDGKVSPQEFTQFAQSINPSIEKDEAFDMFRIFDNNRDGFISYNEFLAQFNVNHFDFGPRDNRDNRDNRDIRDSRDMRDSRDPYAQDKRDPYSQDKRDPYAQDKRDPYAQDKRDPYSQDKRDPYSQDKRDPYSQDNRRDPYQQDPRRDPYQQQDNRSVTLERTRWAGEFFEEVAHLLNVEKMSVGDYFFSYDNTLDRASFRKKLETLGFDLQPDMFDRLTKALATERNPDKIDLIEFNKCFDHYKNNQKVNFNSLKFQRIQQVVRDMKASANKDGLNISRLVESLDKSRYRTCSKSDLEGLLLDKLRLQNNTNIKILYDHLAQDPEKRTMDLKKLEDLIHDGQGGQRDDPYNRSPDVSFGGHQSGRYDEPYKGSGGPRPQDPYNFRREDDHYGDQGAYKGARPGEAPRHADVILDRIKGNIEKLGVNIDQIYKRFVPDGADFITYDQFYKGLMNLDQTLTRDEIKTVFSYLDKDNTGKLSKIRFMTALGKIHSNDIPAFLDWAKPFFREVNKHLEDSRSDLSRVMKPHKGLIEKGTFRQGLYVVGVDTERYSKEIHEVSEILLEGRQEGMNYDVLEACLKRAKEPDAPIWNKKTNFNADEQQKIQKMFQEIAKFMKVDNLSFEQLFLAKDIKKNGWLSEKDMKDVLFNELYVTENPMIDLLIEFCKNDQGNIDLLKFRENLQQGDKVMASVMTLEHFLKDLRERFKNDADSVVKFFDANNNKSISRKEFVDCCKNAMNTDKELALFYFSQLDKSNKGEISTAQFKDALEHDQVSGQQIVGKLKDFVVHNRNYILRSFENLDDSRNRSLTISQMKIAFSNAQFTSTIEELTAVIHKLNVRREGHERYNYDEFIEKLCNVDPEKENLEEIDNILGKLKAKLITKNIDLIPIFKKHDVRGDNTIAMHDVYEDFAAHDIYLNKHEKDLLVPFLQPVNDRINYYDFSRLIFNGRDKLKTKDQFLREAAWAKDIAILAKDGMKKKNLSSARLFGVREGQEFIPARDFYDGLEYIGIRLNNSEMKRLIELLSKPDRPDQVSITMFEYLLQNIEDVQKSDIKTHTPDEMKIIDQRFAEIRQFMKEDRKTYAQIFPKYDRNNSGFISMNEMKKVLDVELGLDITPKLEQFVSLLADRRGMIPLDFIRQNTEITGAPGTTGKNVSFANTTQTSQFVSERPGQGTQSQGPGTAQTRGGPQQSQQLASSQYPNKQSTTDPRYQDPRYQDPRNQQSTTLNPRDMNQTSNPSSLRDVGTGSQSNIRRGGQPIEFSGDLIADMKRFFRDRGYSNSERFAFFGTEGKGVIPRVDFISRVKAMEINNLKETAIVSVFEKLDSNRTGQLSENEFRATFDDNEAQYQTREVNVTKEMDEEIYQLFREIDTDHSNTLTIDEVVKSIAKLGANPTTEEVNRLFAELDKNGDGKISYQEFRSVMAVKLKNNILQLEGLLHDLRTEFKRADLNNRGVLTRAQLGQALLNLNINLSNQELDALFKEIDRDRSGTIDIDEFIGFIMTPPEKSSFGTEADAALMNIKRSRKLSLMEVLDSFKQMPYNFTQSFTRDLTRKCQNIPSSCIKPKPNSSGVYYSDVMPNLNKNDASKLQRRTAFTTSRPQVEYDIMTTPSTLAARVTLNLATGIPIPSENSVDRKTSIVGREVRAIIFSKTTKTFISNIITIDVEWDPTFEDRWSFLPSKTSNENALLLRMAEFNQTKEYDTGLTLVFEFIIFYRKEKELIEMSTGWADVELNELRKSQVLDLKVKGGSPLREININEVDVRANRKGWRNMVKMISKTPITSKLKIEIKTIAQLSVETREDLEFMPAVTLINRNALGLLKVYRNFLGRTLKEAHEKNQNVDLNNDVMARTFWKTMDCPDTWGNIVFFWNQSVSNVSIRTRDPQIAVEYLKKLLKNLYMMFSNNEYRFNESDPCVRVDFDPNLKDTRRRLLVHYTENALADMQIKQENFRPVPLNPQTSSFKPFHIGELIEDDYDYHTIEQLQTLKSSTGSKY